MLDIIEKGGVARSKVVSSLYECAVGLLVSLWECRHDAALVALRGSAKFWPTLTSPLLLEGGWSLRAVTGVMKVVTMEIYYTDVK